MNLGLSILFATILGAFLLLLGPIAGGIIAFGIVAGCLFRILCLLHEQHVRTFAHVPKKDRAQLVYEQYLKDKEIKERSESSESAVGD